MNHNPFRYLQPVTPQTFVGRWDLVNRIVEDLLHANGDSHAIIGGPRSGKTSLLLVLAEQLRQAALDAENAPIPLPVYIDLRAMTFDAAEAVFAFLLQQVYRQIKPTLRSQASDLRSARMGAESRWLEQLIDSPKLAAQDFEEGLLYLLDQCGSATRPACLILLVDEGGKSLDQPWTPALYNQARNLLYNDEFKRRVRLVLASSSRFLDQSSLYDLPLCGMLKLHTLQVFEPAALNELLAYAPGLSSSAQTAIQNLSGGYPFLAQYLLYHVWEATNGVNLDGVESAWIERIAASFLVERGFELEAWNHVLNAIDLSTYHVLSTATDWVAEEQLLATVDAPAQRIRRALLTLCTQGLVAHDGSWTRFHCTGEIFRRVFTTAAAYSPAGTPTASKSAPTYITIDTGGGAYIAGSVQTSGGSFVGHDALARPSLN